MVECGAAEATAQVLKWFNGWKGKKKMRKEKKKLSRALDVVRASAPCELFSVNACNYTGLTARAAMEVVVC